MRELKHRFKTATHNWLVALDQWVFVTLAGIRYVMNGGDPPSPQETISSKVGRSAIAGRRWALISEKIIDYIFSLTGSRPGHCRRAIVEESDWRY